MYHKPLGLCEKNFTIVRKKNISSNADRTISFSNERSLFTKFSKNSANSVKFG